MQRHLLYVDESGSGSLTDYYYSYLFLTGIIIEDKVDLEISAYFNYIKKIYNIPETQAFHSYDLFENIKDSKILLSPKKAKRLVLSLIEFIKVVPIKVSVYYIDKRKLRFFLGMKVGEKSYFRGIQEKSERNQDIPYEILSTKLFFWFSNFLTTKKSLGAVVAESRDVLDYALLKTYLKGKDTNQFRSENMKVNSERMKNHLTSIRFECKGGFWPTLELADLFSYIAFLKITGKIRKRFSTQRDLNKLWKAIETKIERKRIISSTKHTFQTYLGSGRVNRISKLVKQKNKLITD